MGREKSRKWRHVWGPVRALSDGVGWGRRHGPWGVGKKWMLGGSERPRLKAWLLPQLWALWHPIARPIIWDRDGGSPVGSEVTGFRGGVTWVLRAWRVD